MTATGAPSAEPRTEDRACEIKRQMRLAAEVWELQTPHQQRAHDLFKTANPGN
jgi:hypothetical protein